MADDQAGDIRVIAWQDWRVPHARLGTPYSTPWDGDGPAPPGPPVEDPPVLPFVVLAWQQWLVPRARLSSQYAGGAFDDSVAVIVPLQPDTAHWQPTQVRRPAGIDNPYLFSTPWDGDAPAPPALVPDFPPPAFSVLAWQDWQAPRARLRRQVTDAPQDRDGLTFPTPDQSLVVLPWFAGRVPLERARTIYSSPVAEGPEPAQPETMTSYTWGRGYHPSRVNPQARVMTVISGPAQDTSAAPTALTAEYIPTYRPRRRV